jgi:glycosyltransferase involved in cell wall biosynthesis
MNKLTVIIPFLNEGEELERTVQSIRQTAGDNVDILLINDASQDDIDYEKVAQTYHAEYIKNKKRKGVAQSRDMGVSMIDTPYFILMDAHMRLYKDNWWSEILKYIEQDDRAVYCLKCLVLSQDREAMTDRYGTGAYIKLYAEIFDTVLDPAWISSGDNTVFDIPCVLGASYIMSKRYWEYIKGLSLLRYYGSDEAYLSLKVWMEGGSCKLIPDVEVGHIFRTKAPYRMSYTDSIFNKLMIVETMLPEDYVWYVHARMKLFNKNDYFFALSLLNRKKQEIAQLKEYYKSIFTRDFSFFKELNNKYYAPESTIPGDTYQDTKIYEIAQYIAKFQTEQTGLMSGSTGELIFLCEYHKYIEDTDKKNNIEMQITKQIDAILENIKCKKSSNRNFATGLAGQGIGLIYLQNRGYINVDIEEILEYIDEELFAFAAESVKKQNFGYMQGALGAGYYFLHRNGDRFSQYIKYLISEIEHSFTNNVQFSIDMPQGILGVLQFLILADNYQKADKKNTLNIIRKFTEYILSQEQDFEKTGYYFPENLENPQKTGLSWQSGDLIAAYILLNASKILNDNNLYNKSMDILLSTADRLDPVIEDVRDAGFYHGSSGIAYIYYKLYKQTGKTRFKESCDYWLQETLYKAVVYKQTAGYTINDYATREQNMGLFAGIAGIGLSFLSIKNEVYLPDTFFLL